MPVLREQVEEVRRFISRAAEKVNSIISGWNHEFYSDVNEEDYNLHLKQLQEISNHFSSATAAASTIEERLKDVKPKITEAGPVNAPGETEIPDDIVIKEEFTTVNTSVVSPEGFYVDDYDDFDLVVPESCEIPTVTTTPRTRDLRSKLNKTEADSTTAKSKQIRRKSTRKRKQSFNFDEDDGNDNGTSRSVLTENSFSIGMDPSPSKLWITPDSSHYQLDDFEEDRQLKIVLERVSPSQLQKANNSSHATSTDASNRPKRVRRIKNVTIDAIKDEESESESDFGRGKEDEDWKDEDDVSSDAEAISDNFWDKPDRKTSENSKLKNLNQHRKKKKENVEKPVYKCESCQKVFKSRSYYREHLRIHTGRRDFQCPECDKAFTAKRLLVEHKNRIHCEVRKRFDEMIKAGIGSLLAVEELLKSEEGSKSQLCTCPECERIFFNKNSLQRHLKTHTQYHTIYRCPYCVLSYNTKLKLEGHVRQIHSEERKKDIEERKKRGEEAPYKCSICEKPFWNKACIPSHELTHSADRSKDFKCSEPGCEKAFTRHRLLKQHEMSHSVKVYHCPHCSEEFENPHKRGSHIRTEHPDESGAAILRKNAERKSKTRHPCSTCKKSFSSRYILKMHMVKHTGIRKYQCDYCEKAFFEPKLLKNHLKIHTGEKTIKCEHCPLTFSYYQLYQSHKARHHMERPKQLCTQCGKLFIGINTLKNHILDVHEKLRPHKCHLCPKSFKKKTHLNYHVKTHDNPNGRKRGLNKDKSEKLLLGEAAS